MTADRRLVVNADDLGLSEGVNRGILRAHAEGIVTTASLMVRRAAAAHAVAAAAAHPALDLGLHVDLAEWACERDGTWHPVYEVVDAADPEAVAAELEAQLAAFTRLTGRTPTHLDSHQHLHRAEPVQSILGIRARELGIPLRHHGRVRYCGAFYGQGHAGTPLPGAITPTALAGLIQALPEGITELCCHPAATVPLGQAYGPERLRELEALCHGSVRAAIERGAIRLGTFREVLRDLVAT